MRKTRLWRLSLPALLMTSGCATLFQPRTEAAMPYTTYGDVDKAEHLVLLLPGIRDRMGDFAAQGFIDIARPLLQQYPGSAVLAVDAHWGYYRERSIAARLREDILQRFPDKKLTLVGISLGGFGSLLTAGQQPARIQRLVLLSPFLGEDDYAYLEQLQASGPVDQRGDEDLHHSLNRIWRFLLDPQRRIPVTLAYGEKDSFTPYYDYLRSRNPANLQFMSIRGGHNWPTWRSLWQALAPTAIGGNY